jgi:hypothetical protein
VSRYKMAERLGEAVSGRTVDAGNHLLTITGPPLMTGGKFGIEGGLVAIAITVLATPLICWIYRNRPASVA